MLLKDLSHNDRCKLIGELNWLALHSDIHRQFKLEDQADLLFPALEHNTYQIYRDKEGKAIGYITWAFFTAENQVKFLSGEYIPTLSEWIDGDQLTFIDLVAPFGHFRKILKHLRDDKFKDYKGIAKALRFTSPGKNKGTVEYKHK